VLRQERLELSLIYTGCPTTSIVFRSLLFAASVCMYDWRHAEVSPKASKRRYRTIDIGIEEQYLYIPLQDPHRRACRLGNLCQYICATDSIELRSCTDPR
jgi:hypothetical protein